MNKLYAIEGVPATAAVYYHPRLVAGLSYTTMVHPRLFADLRARRVLYTTTAR